MFIDYDKLIEEGELDALAREACNLTVSNERLFELLAREELRGRIEKWYNSVWRGMDVLNRLHDFVNFLHQKVETDGISSNDFPDSWLLKFFGFNLDLTTRYMVVDETWK